ncbi:MULTISPECIES: methylated-DNA--[protein]-cysteine S-methyltransferase [unclassified Virgibacillus]|uniref:methylated-DNA--[protein]-cysteine S-methyltransferase n=1 Tax=unclassified Virgibacillus TaxID=2620237 RepID=UPI0024DF03AF|nr:methylated-DNA--[protein]-cysteine S-methyltransferase [Virgibacillus sp. LDC-1]
MTIYWTTFQQGEWRFYVAATENGICYLSPQHIAESEMHPFLQKQLPNEPLEENEEKLTSYISELREYVDGSRKEFSAPIDLYGTAFQKQVWQALQHIPFGKTVTYSEIAHSIGNPRAVRAVAAAIGANPVLVVIPCHRVIGKNGALTGFRGGLDMKEKLLQLERAESVSL